jgi:hypothetical protein
MGDLVKNHRERSRNANMETNHIGGADYTPSIKLWAPSATNLCNRRDGWSDRILRHAHVSKKKFLQNEEGQDAGQNQNGACSLLPNLSKDSGNR